MAGGSTSSREQNFWPGFVDALTNVVLVMVFIVVVFSVSLFYFTSKMARMSIAKQVEQQVAAQAETHRKEVDDLSQGQSQRVADLTAKLAATTAENTRLREALRSSAGATAREAQPATGSPDVQGEAGTRRRTVPVQSPVTLSGSGDLIVVTFAPGVTSMEKKLYEALDAAVGGYANAAQWSVSMTAESAEASPSEGKRLGFYRIAMLRDHLVAKGVVASRIDNVIQDAGPSDSNGRSRVLLRLRRSP